MKKSLGGSLRRLGALVMAVVMALGSTAAAGYAFLLPSSASDTDTIASYAPTGCTNVAIGATMTVSKCSANKAGSMNSYEMPSESWALSNLVDGNLSNGWSTNPYDKETNRSAPVTLDMHLKTASDISAVALFPYGCFPAEYSVLVSSDGQTYTKVADGSCDVATPSGPMVHTFATVNAEYVRIEITQRSVQVTNDGALAQLGEIAVYGKAEITMKTDRSALELLVGDTDTLTAVFSGNVSDTSVTWKSSNTSVVTIDAKGVLTAKKLGTATITATSPLGLSATCSVEVVEKRLDLDENIMLSIFWPPTEDYINDEQYKLLADAGINWVMGAGEETLATVANQEKMLELCNKYGLNLIVQDGSFGSSLASKSEETIASQVANYKNVPALGGFYILDEPYNANQFVSAYVALKKAFPEGYMHLNFLPSASYGSVKIYQAQMNDWCRLCEAAGYPVDYLIYDRYPFGLSAGTMDRSGFYTNLRAVHDVGLENDVRTGTYIQTVCQEVAFRRPTDAEIRYEMYSALAFGFKQLSFFTWFTPTNRNEPFTDGIIAADGTPNAHYETIKTINHEILAIGSTLVKCDALEIYLNGSDTFGQPTIPSDFFVQPEKKTQYYTLSWLRHKETGRNYLMIVNNNFVTSQTINLSFDEAITELYEVSRTDGSLSALALTDHKLELTLEAGDAIFLALPEGLDYLVTDNSQPDAQTNLALDGQITCSESQGADGYYMSFLNDGTRFSESSVVGWRSNGTDPSSIVLDLKSDYAFNRVDLYPTGTLFNYGETFPSDFTISVSSDGVTYTQVASRTGCAIDTEPLSVTFDTVTARYIRIDITGCNSSFAALCEIEVYNDDGTVPAPTTLADVSTDDVVVVYKEGADLAYLKPVYVSSEPQGSSYRAWGWASDFINNGVSGQGWTSNIKANTTPNSTEYVIIDLQDVFAIDSVVVTTMGVFPENFRIEMSTDGKNWTPIVSVTGAKSYSDGTVLTFTPDDGQAVVGRYLRFIGTRLRGTSLDGYMLQLGNISAYGTPVCDTTALRNAIDLYKEQAGDLKEQAYLDAVAALDVQYLTQSQANSYTKALLAFLEIEEEETTEEGTTQPLEPETNPPETDPVTGTGTESDVETNLATEPSQDTTADTSAPESTTEATASSGCSSALGAASLAVLSAGAAAVALTKKKKEQD